MANQYTPDTSVMHQCLNEGCTEMIRRTPYQVRKGIKQYCSGKCAMAQPRKFKEEDAVFILENSHKMTMIAMAQHFKVTASTFYKLCHHLRSRGWAIPMGDGRRKTSLTEEQKQYVIKNFPKKTTSQMCAYLKVKAHIIRTFVEAYNNGEVKLKKKGKPVTHKRIIPMPAKPGKIENLRNHNDRKPPVAPPFKRKEEVFKTRKIDEKGLIPVVFNDKNKTKFMARDEEHAERIRKTYAYLNKPVEARF